MFILLGFAELLRSAGCFQPLFSQKYFPASLFFLLRLQLHIIGILDVAHGPLRLCSFSFSPSPLAIYTGFCWSVTKSCPTPCDPMGSGIPALQTVCSFSQLPCCSTAEAADSMEMKEHSCYPTKLRLQNQQQGRLGAQAIIRPPLFLGVRSKSCPLTR